MLSRRAFGKIDPTIAGPSLGPLKDLFLLGMVDRVVSFSIFVCQPPTLILRHFRIGPSLSRLLPVYGS